MPTIPERLETATTKVETDATKMHQIVHGGPTVVVTTEGGPVKSLAKAVNDLEESATASAAAALASKNAAAASETAAAGSASTANTKAGEAAASASTASTKATEASNSASAASGSASAAATSASNAATSATNSANSATASDVAKSAAQTAQTAAELARAQAEALLASVVGQVEYKGTWAPSTNTPTLANPTDTSTKGFYYVASDSGTRFGMDFQTGDWIISNGATWEKVDNTDAVVSVAGRTGAITLSISDITNSTAIGQALVTAADAAAARTSLGLGTADAPGFSGLTITNASASIIHRTAGDLDTNGSAYMSWQDYSTGSWTERGWIGFGYGDGSVTLSNNTGGAVDIQTTHGRVLTVTSNGRVGINKRDPGSTFHVVGNSYFRGADSSFIVDSVGVADKSMWVGDYDTPANACGIYLRSTSASYIRSAGGTLYLVANATGNNGLIVDVYGNVAIGPNGPNYDMDIHKNVDGLVASRIRNNSQHADARSVLLLNAYGNSWGIGMGSYANNANTLTVWEDFLGNAYTRFSIAVGGAVGIGMAPDANYRLSVSGDLAVKDAGQIRLHNTGNSAWASIGFDGTKVGVNYDIGTSGKLRIGSTYFDAVTPTNWGYSDQCKVTMIGSPRGTANRTVAISYDPIGNTDGSFGGDGTEILFARGAQFCTPNAANNAFFLKNLVMQDGKVGIGVTPAYALEMYTADETILVWQRTGGAKKWGFGADSSGTYLKNATDGSISMFFKNAGPIGIGLTNPISLLHLQGGINDTPLITADVSYGAGISSAGFRTTLNSNAGGLYLSGYSNEATILYNTEYLGSIGQVARGTTALILSMTPNGFSFRYNTSVTVNDIYTPTEVMLLNGAGLHVVGWLKTAAPYVGGNATWRLGDVSDGTISANKVVRVEIAGQIYFLAAATSAS